MTPRDIDIDNQPAGSYSPHLAAGRLEPLSTLDRKAGGILF